VTFSANSPEEISSAITNAAEILSGMPFKTVQPENDFCPDPARIAQDLRALEMRVDILYDVLRRIFSK